MPFNLKVVYQGKTINLGNKVTSFSQIQEEIEMRLSHPISGTLSYKYDHQPIINYQNIIDIVKVHQLNSIKLFAQTQKLVSSQSDMNSFSMLSEIKSESEASSFMNSEQSDQSKNRNSVVISLKEFSEDNDILVEEASISGLSFLVVDQVNESMSLKSQRQQSSVENSIMKNIFKNEERESTNELDELLEKRMNDLLKENVLVPKEEYAQFMKFKKNKEEKAKSKIKFPECLNPFKKEEKKLNNSKIQHLSSKITVSQKSSNHKAVISGIQFLWEFSITYPSELKKFDLCIMDQITGYMTPLKAKNFCVGPFVATKQEHFERSFRICFFSEDSIKFIGPKFGFKVAVVHYKEQKVELDSQFQEEIRKKVQEKDIKADLGEIMEKLKYIGIDEQNFKQEEEIIEQLLDNL